MMKLSEKWLRIIKTCNLYLIFITLGMYMSVLGPCLLSIRDLVHTDTQHIGIIYTARSIGFITGSVLSGMILDLTKYKQVIMTACIVVLSAVLLTIPWCSSLGILIACLIVASICMSFLQSGGYVLCLKIWGKDNAPYFHALHFVFGLGALIAPLIAAPFLGDRQDAFPEAINNATHTTNFTTTYNYNSTYTGAYNISSTNTTSKIVFPFSIIGLYSVLVSVMSLFICIISPTDVEGQDVQNEQNSGHQLRFVVTILMLAFLFIFAISIIEVGYSQMLTTYVVNGYLKLPSSVGSYMTSIFWIAYTVSRLVTVFAAFKLSHFNIIINNLILISVGALLLLFLASHEWALWVSCILLGGGVAPFFAATTGWLNVYITVTNRMAAFLITALTTGNMVIPFTIGYFTEILQDIFIYLIFAACIFSCVLVLLLFLTLRKRQKKCDNPKIEPTCFPVGDTPED